MDLEKRFTETDAKEIKSLLEGISISNKTVLTTKEIAKYLDVKTSTIDSWCSNRTITFYKLEGSNKRYFKRQEIETWVTTYKIRSRKEVKSSVI